MSIPLLVAGVFGLILSVLGIAMLPRIWSGRERPSFYNEWGMAITRGMVRAVPVAIVTIALTTLFAFSVGVRDYEPSDPANAIPFTFGYLSS